MTLWFISLEGKKKAKCEGVDTSKIYTYFTLIYLVFCVVLTPFWNFYMLFYLVGDPRVMRLKKEEMGPNKKMEACATTQDIMPQHEEL